MTKSKTYKKRIIPSYYLPKSTTNFGSLKSSPDKKVIIKIKPRESNDSGFTISNQTISKLRNKLQNYRNEKPPNHTKINLILSILSKINHKWKKYSDTLKR